MNRTGLAASCRPAVVVLVTSIAKALEGDPKHLPATAFVISYRRYLSTQAFIAEIRRIGLSGTPIGALRLLNLLVRRRPSRKYLEKILRVLDKITHSRRSRDSVFEEEASRVKLSVLAAYLRRPLRSGRLTPRDKQRDNLTLTVNPLAQNAPAFKLFSFLPTKIAEQLTLIDHDLFSAIQLEDFFDKGWEKKDRRSALSEFIARSDRISNWVASHILVQTSNAGQAHVVEKFLEVGKWCDSMGNYHAVAGIFGGLSQWCISRLTRTWKIHQGHKLVHAHLHSIISNERNYAVYRGLLAERMAEGKPAIPHVGVVLRDITFIEDGNPDFLANGTPNVEKIAQMGNVLGIIAHFQHVKYHEKKEIEPQLMIRLRKLPSKPLKWLENRSTELRPAKTTGSEDVSFQSGSTHEDTESTGSSAGLVLEEVHLDDATSSAGSDSITEP